MSVILAPSHHLRFCFGSILWGVFQSLIDNRSCLVFHGMQSVAPSDGYDTPWNSFVMFTPKLCPTRLISVPTDTLNSYKCLCASFLDHMHITDHDVPICHYFSSSCFKSACSFLRSLCSYHVWLCLAWLEACTRLRH